jgi:YHS domain-containing protein
MEWITDNWIWLLLGGAMVAMHLFGHGHGSGHKKGHAHNVGHGRAETRAAGRCGSHGGGHANETSEKGESRWVAPKEFVDPVCGKAISTDDSKPSVHDGQVYYFCSHQCRDAFEAAPPEFTARVKVEGGPA